MKRLVVITMAAGLLFAMDAIGETETAEPDALLEYVEATGSQYIDTGVNAETGLKARIDLEWRGTLSNKDWAFLNACKDADLVADKRTRVFLCHINSEKPFFGYGLKSRGNPGKSFKFVSGKRCEVLCDISDSSSIELYQNGKKTFSAREPTNTEQAEYSSFENVNLGLNLYLFAGNGAGTARWHCQARLYELKIFKKNDDGLADDSRRTCICRCAPYRCSGFGHAPHFPVQHLFHLYK